jgi:hypothetical protein
MPIYLLCGHNMSLIIGPRDVSLRGIGNASYFTLITMPLFLKLPGAMSNHVNVTVHAE